MNIGRACGIFMNIDSDNFTEDEKLVAIRDVLKEMVTYNGITKDNILKAFRWFYDWAGEEMAEDGKDTNVPSKWIPCSERLPEEPKENPLFEGTKVELYLVSCGEEFYPFRAFWNGKNFTDGLCKVEVEAYMPLPPAYKEDKE